MLWDCVLILILAGSLSCLLCHSSIASRRRVISQRDISEIQVVIYYAVGAEAISRQ